MKDYSITPLLKHKVIGQNIANADTKNYKRRDVEFKEILKSNLEDITGKKNDKKELKINIDEESPIISDGNNVDVNKEMSDMAENSIMFKFASKKLNAYYTDLQNVIRGGNR